MEKSFQKFKILGLLIVVIAGIFVCSTNLFALTNWVSGKTGAGVQFENSSLYIGNVGSVRTVEFWLNNSNSTDGILELTGSNYISISSNAISLTGFNNSTVYVNGIATTALGSGWNHVAVTSDTISATAFTIGVANGNYMGGSIDEVKLYDRVLSATEIRYHYNKGKPIAHWKFDEGSGATTYDSGDPGGNNGTLENGPQWVAGKYGSALSFDGNNDYVNLGSSVGDFGTDDFTIEVWLYNEDIDGNPYFMGIYDGSNDYWLLRSQPYALSIDIWYAGKRDEVFAFTTISNNVWYHFVVTGDRDGLLKVYINGECYNSKSMSNFGSMAWTNPLKLGKPFTSQIFQGIIDDVRIYNYTRTPDEIRLDYNAGFEMYFR